VVELARVRLVAVLVARCVREIEAIAVQVLAPVVARVQHAELEARGRAEREPQFALAGPAAERVAGQRLGVVPPRRAVVLPAPLAAHVERAQVLALDERTAERAVVDVVVVDAGAEELVAGAGEVVAHGLERAAVALAALPGDHVHHAGHDAAVLRIEAAVQQYDLLDGAVVDRGRGVAGERVALRNTVHVVGRLARPAAAQDERVRVRPLEVELLQVVHHARLLRHRVVVAARGQTPDLVAAQEPRGTGGVHLKQRPLRVHHRLVHLGGLGLERGVQRGREVGRDLHVRSGERGVPDQAHANGAATARDPEDEVGPLIVRDRSEPLPLDPDVDPGERLLLLVHDAADQPAGGARERRRPESQAQRSRDERAPPSP